MSARGPAAALALKTQSRLSRLSAGYGDFAAIAAAGLALRAAAPAAVAGPVAATRLTSRPSTPVVYPSVGQPHLRLPSGVGSLRRHDRPRDAVVPGVVRHPALERQQRSRTWLGHHEERAPNHHDMVARRPLPRQEALRDASKLPAPAVDRRQLRTVGRGQRRMSRAAPTARGDAALAAAWLRRTRPTRRSEAAPVARGGEAAG